MHMHMCVYLPIYLSIYLFICQYIYLSIDIQNINIDVYVDQQGDAIKGNASENTLNSSLIHCPL